MKVKSLRTVHCEERRQPTAGSSLIPLKNNRNINNLYTANHWKIFFAGRDRLPSSHNALFYYRFITEYFFNTSSVNSFGRNPAKLFHNKLFPHQLSLLYMSENTKQAPIAVGATEGQNLSIAGGNYRVLASGKQTGGAFATIEMLVPPNGGPGPHSHADFHETFYVLDGKVEVKSEAGTYTATQGAYVVIPKGGIVHCFKNKTDTLARLLCTVVPAGLEEMFIAIGTPVQPGEFLPPPPMDPESLKKMLAIAEKFGQKVYPPDYLG